MVAWCRWESSSLGTRAQSGWSTRLRRARSSVECQRRPTPSYRTRQRQVRRRASGSVVVSCRERASCGTNRLCCSEQLSLEDRRSRASCCELLRAVLAYLPLTEVDKQRMLEKFVSVTRATLKGTTCSQMHRRAWPIAARCNA